MPKAPSKKRSYFAGRWLNLAKRWQVWALANAAVVFVVVLALLLGQAGFTRLRNLYLALMVVLIVGLFIISVGWWVLRAEPRRERMLKKKTGAQGYGKGDQPVPGYHLAQFLGRGSFGEVWKASAPGGTECALKIIRFDDAQAFKELRAICWRVKGMHHPHLTPIIAFWFKDQQGNMLSDPSDAELGSLKRPVTELIIAMGLGEKNLADRLKECLAEGKPGIPARELLVYMAEAAKAIDFLNQPRHELGTKRVAIRRGDIKPQNILIVGGCAQVCDFGLPQQLTYARKVSMAAGTYAYIAPESIENKLSKTNDQYSLAICYVELRTGSLPFSANSLYEVMFAHLQGKLDFSKLSEAERAVLKRATATNPDHRFPNTVEMVRALRQAIKEET